MKITRRTKLLVVALTLCFTTMIGSTFAWFTDTVESDVNTITAGNLDMVVEYKTKWEDKWTELTENTKLFDEDALWEPGHTEAVALRITNKGTLAFKYDYALNVISETPSVNVYDDEFKLSDSLKLLYTAINGEGTIGDMFMMQLLSDRNKAQGEGMIMSEGEFGTFVADSTAHLLPGVSHVVGLSVSMPTTVGNEANHKYGTTAPSINFGLSVVATQAVSEADSFGNDYDADAEYPTLPIKVVDAQGLKDAMLIRDAHIVLANDIVVDKDTPLQWGAYMFVANGREVTIDLNGKEIIVEEDASLKTNGLFTTANGGTLNIIGEGTVEVKNGQSGIFHAMNPNDQINVYSGTYISNSNNDSDALAIIYTNRGEVDVYGGKFCPLEDVPCANAEDIQGDKLFTMFHEGTLLKHDKYYTGDDATRIQLAEGCTLQEVTIDGETWYKVVKQ